MNKEYFTENISDETLAGLIDETLNYEKSKKTKKITPANLVKILSAAAVVVLVIGAINILPGFLKNMGGPSDGANSVVAGTNTDTSTKVDSFVPADPNKIDLFVPDTVEKSFFEDKVLATITNTRDYNTMKSYYALVGQFYLLAPNTSDREISMLLDIYKKYTNLTGNDIIQMCLDNNIISGDPSIYAHVKFGATNNTLLLDVEWYTADEYEQEIAEPYQKSVEDYKKSDEYANLSDKEKNAYDTKTDNYIKANEQAVSDIKNKNEYAAKTINGKSAYDIGGLSIYYSLPIDISQYFDANGYYIFNIYPYYPSVYYFDENGVSQFKGFGTNTNHNFVSSKEEYTSVLENEIIPYCDDLLAKGLITQEAYDRFTIKDPLEYYVNRYFN
ncbi:MAG: hypothetical protein FWD71_10165 [Oscillospiraceae bacterium]|nr:hypothetical protein [Oscillospiraceae bacterium]